MKILIRNGKVADGTGAPAYRADVLIEDGKIADVTDATGGAGGIRRPPLDSARGREVGGHPGADEVIEAKGLMVAPGFIDVHSHSDFTLLLDPRAVSAISQGVTLEAIGNCGHGCAPVADPKAVATNIYGFDPAYEMRWRTTAEFLARLEAGRPAVNVLTLIPNGNLRLAAIGLADRPATPDELKQMKSLLAEGLEAGAFGYSTGLEYGAERGCSETEVAELCRMTAKAGGLYATHTRNREGEAHETIAEAIRTAEAAGVPLQISHISSVSRLSANGGEAIADALSQVDQARARGLDVTFDMHTRPFGTTNLSAALPQWALEGGPAATAARLRDPSARERMKSHRSIITSLARDDWTRIVVYECRSRPEYSRQSIAEISRRLGVSPFDAICEILVGEGENMHTLMILGMAYRAEDISCIFERAECMIGSDATTLAPDGPLKNSTFHGAYTWAAWFFRHFVREKGLLTAEDAVRRMTSLPAARLGVKDRGVIRKGAWADLAIFDPETFGEKGTPFEPNQVAQGMAHVLVNGTITLRDGTLTGERNGRVLRR